MSLNIKKTLTILLSIITIKTGNYFISSDLYEISPKIIQSCQLFENKINIKFKLNEMKNKFSISNFSGKYLVNFLNTALRENLTSHYTTKYHKLSNDNKKFDSNFFEFENSSSEFEIMNIHYDENFFGSYSNGITQSFVSLYGNGNYFYFYPNLELEVSKFRDLNISFENKKIGQKGCLNIHIESDCKLPAATIFDIKIPKKKYSDENYNFKTFSGCEIELNGEKITYADCQISEDNFKINNLFSGKISNNHNIVRVCGVTTPELTDQIEINLFYQNTTKRNLFKTGKFLPILESPDFQTSFINGAMLKKNLPYFSEIILKTEHKFMTEAKTSLIFTFPGVMSFIKDLKIEITDVLSGKKIVEDLENNSEKIYSVEIPHELFFENGVNVKLNCDEKIPEFNDFGYMEILLVDNYGKTIGNAKKLFIQFVN